ncbi:MAG: GIY-YIG nuclease family protein [Cyanobium sp. D14.bin.5]|nr:GIY-YIG nuclease family protein [Cyanobium sp. D14.bin.5]
MSSTPKTIQIFLPSGEPHGIRIAEITTRIVQVIEVPRSLLADFLAMEQSSQVGVYVLVGEDTGDDDRRVYVGQSGDLRARLAQHHQKKDFWQRALVLISRTNSLTQTHALFLEWHALQQLRQVGRFRDENGTSGSRPHTPAPLEADCMEIFETGSTLFSTLGFPLFDPLATAAEAENPAELFFCRSPGAGVDGRGLYTPEGFVVLAGSVGRLENVPSIQGTNDGRSDGGVRSRNHHLPARSSLPQPQQRSFSVVGAHCQWLAGMEEHPRAHPQPGEAGISALP